MKNFEKFNDLYSVFRLVFSVRVAYRLASFFASLYRP